MGGKHKQANRTKNNARPASSGRSAELLGSKAPPFVGFNVLKPVMTNFREDLDPEINQDFQLVMKKMNKKDATTKLKALQEFTTLCRESDPAAVKAILPFWPRLYCALATDMEHRIREGAHAAHRAVVASVGRNIAPHLKQLAGPWFTGQYDTYAPAATTATLAFQEAFPPNKITEAIIFCQEEILNYIFNNLLTHTAKSLIDEKKNNAEEMEAKYQRVIISSLHGYAFYLNRLPPEQIQSSAEANRQLVGSAKFWKYAKHETPLIRAAWFTALISLCQKAPFLLVDEGKHLGTAVFGNLDEADPTVLPIVWEAALHTLVVVEDIWKHVSAEKLVFPKLWRILREGGQGNATMIFPNMLPLLSKIPQSVIGTRLEFYTNFFDNIRSGLKLRSVQSSSSEMEAIITSFIECVRYLVMVNYEDTELCLSVLINQVLPLIEYTMTGVKLQHASLTLFCCLSKLIRHWTKQNEEIYNKLLNSFWEKMVALCEMTVQNLLLEKDMLSTTLHAQNNLLIALKNPEMRRQKKNLKVKFSVPESPKIATEKEIDEDFKSTSTESSKIFDEQVDNLKNTLIGLYMQLTNNNSSIQPLLVEQISKVVTEFNSEQTFTKLIESVGSIHSWQEVYSTKLLDWLLDELIPVEYSLTIIFTLLQYVTEEEKCLVLQDLRKTRVHDILKWCVQQGSSYPIVKEWLLSDQLVDILVSVAANVSKHDSSYNILDSCLRIKEDGNLLVSQNALNGILNMFVNILTSLETSDATKTCVALLIESAVLIDSNYSYIIQQNSSVPSLVTAVFKSMVQKPAIIELKDTWKIGVTTLSKAYGIKSPRFILIAQGTSQVIVDYFNKSVMNIIETANFVILVKEFMFSAISYDSDVTELDDHKEDILLLLKLILDALVENCKKWCMTVKRLCMNSNHIGGILNIPSTEQVSSEEVDPLNKEDIEKYIVCSYFQLELLYSFCHIHPGNSELPLVLSKNGLKELSSYLSDSVLLYSLSQSFQQYFSQTKQYFTLRKHISQIENFLMALIEETIEQDTMKIVAVSVYTNALNVGEQWLRTISVELPQLPRLEKSFKEVVIENIQSNDKHIREHFMQSFTGLTCKQLIDHCVSLLTQSDDLVFLPDINVCLNKIGDNLDETVCNIYDSFFDRIIGCNKQNDLCFEDPKSNVRMLNSVVDMAKFLCIALKFYNNRMKQSHWDVCMVRVASWVQGIHSSIVKMNLGNDMTIQWVSAVSATCRLMDTICRKIIITDESDEIAKTRHTEWKDVFESTLHKTFIQSWHCVAEQSCTTSLQLLLIENLSYVVSEHVFYTHFIDNTSGNSVRDWLTKCCKLIKSPVTTIQITAYCILNKLIPAMVTMDSEYSETESGGLSCLCLEETLQCTQTVVDTMMSELRFGDTCIVEAFTDSYTYARAYLLLWATLLELCAQSNSQLRSLYTAWLKEEYLPVLMKTVFCLMPESVVHEWGNSKRTQDLFSNVPELTNVVWDSDKLAQVSCWVYTCALRRLPAAIRQWWNKSEHKVWTIVDHITSTFISPLLSAEEMKAIKKEEKKFDNMTILVHPSVREIVAVYVVEDCSMELVINLANNHPLGLVKVYSGKSMVSTAQIKQWHLQLTIFLTHQNGSIWDGLALWKNSLDKRFEGVEECYICFSILHITSHQLPKLSCQTCRKKFHSPCLYKWFTTSNKSTCPICRNLF